MTTQATITIGGVTLAIEMLDDRRGKTIGRIFHAAPLPLPEWPISANDIQARAQTVFDACGCRPGVRNDAVWAINKAGIEYDATARYYFHAVPTAAEQRDIEAAARDGIEDLV